MQIHFRRAALAALLMIIAAPAARAKPRLLVLIVVDQLRAGYLWRLHDDFVAPDAGKVTGFRWLAAGAEFPAAQYRHFPLYTGPGHACLGTGGYPYKHGIVSNDWYDRATRTDEYCVSQPSAMVTGPAAASAKPMGPENLLSSTLGDEMKLATGGQAKVVSMSLKDRAAILMAGRLADAVLWYDGATGNWISSDSYGPALPAWVDQLNAKKVPDYYRGKPWRALRTPQEMFRRGAFAVLGGTFGVPRAGDFAADVNQRLADPGAGYYKAFTLTPYANEYVLRTACDAVRAMDLGQDEQTDLLCMNLATNDYVGHQYGPNSHETMDITLQTDRALATFFAYLEANVPGGLDACTIALSADHGVCPMPEQMRELGFPAHETPPAELIATINSGLKARFGLDDLLVAAAEPYLYLDRHAIATAKLDQVAVEDETARLAMTHAGIYGAWSTTRIQRGQIADTDLGRRLARAVHPKVSGDVVIVDEEGSLINDGSYGTSHGSPYAYDNQVPLLLRGAGIRPGLYFQDVEPIDIVSTYAQLVGVLRPSACEGDILPCTR